MTNSLTRSSLNDGIAQTLNLLSIDSKNLNIEVFVPSIGRSSLKATLESLNSQTVPAKIKVTESSSPFLDKVREMVESSDADLVAICDDDAEYPAQWLESLVAYFDMPRVAFAGGPCLPLLTADSSETSRSIAFASTNFLGSLWMSQRYKDSAFAEERTETGIVGSGVYRREILKQILQEDWSDIPRGAWETFVFTRMREKGLSTLYIPGGRFYHTPRQTFHSFSRQAYRSGVGRMAVLRTKPTMIIRKSFLLLPLLALAYFLVASTHGFFWPLILYTGFLVVASGFSPRNMLAILVLHASYSLGLIAGTVKRHASWT